jgi:Mg2+ and Co2+ transporter CorA
MPDAINDDEQTPLFPKWSYWYALVIGVLILLIIFFYFLTKHFS